MHSCLSRVFVASFVAAAATFAIPGTALADPITECVMGGTTGAVVDPGTRAFAWGLTIASALLLVAVLSVLFSLALFLVRRSRRPLILPIRAFEEEVAPPRHVAPDIGSASPVPT